MAWLDWLRPPRSVLTFYLAGTLAAATALGWLGWRLLDQETVLERTRAQERLEVAADRAVAMLQRSLDDLERAAEAGGRVAEGTVAVKADRTSFRADPPGRLVFYPIVTAPPGPSRGRVPRGGGGRVRGAGPCEGCGHFPRSCTDSISSVRAGALLVRLGRTLRKAGRYDEALGVYDDLARPRRVCGRTARRACRSRGSLQRAAGDGPARHTRA